MTDVVSKEKRSEIMSHIKSENTSIELLVRRKLFSLGFRYRVNYKKLPGKPDIVFIKKKIAIFIHGCFWHGHNVGCRYSHVAQSRKEYWEKKIERTRQRDIIHEKELLAAGWQVVTIWECQIKNSFEEVIMNLIPYLS